MEHIPSHPGDIFGLYEYFCMQVPEFMRECGMRIPDTCIFYQGQVCPDFLAWCREDVIRCCLKTVTSPPPELDFLYFLPLHQIVAWYRMEGSEIEKVLNINVSRGDIYQTFIPRYNKSSDQIVAVLIQQDQDTGYQVKVSYLTVRQLGLYSDLPVPLLPVPLPFLLFFTHNPPPFPLPFLFFFSLLV